MSRQTKLSLLALSVLTLAACVGLLYHKRHYGVLPPFVVPRPWGMSRPYGMAPVAFDAYVRACYRTGIHPNRIGQTIGDHPDSVGYHKRDGVVTVKRVKYDYCAAVDLGVPDLTSDKINHFLHELTLQGFACWYRHGGKWSGKEHIHAVYALLPMKPQLRGQVNQFLSERRAAGLKPLVWETKLRRYARMWSRRRDRNR